MRKLLIVLGTALLLLPAVARAQDAEPKPDAKVDAEVNAETGASADAETESDAEVGQGEEIFAKVIEALGGDAFLNVAALVREGRIYSFEGGVLSGPGQRFKNYVKFRDKEWTEFGKHGRIVYLYSGEEGWELDRQGISDASPESVENWSETTRLDPEYLLRFRVREEEMPIYYNGKEFLDNRMAHVLEIFDEDSESLVLYLDARTYLPMQLRYSKRNPLLRSREPVIEYYGKYIDIDGVLTPFHIMRERNGEKVLEVFLKDVILSEDVPDEFFTRENLEKRWKKVKR